MKVLLLALVVLAVLIIIACGIWVGVALINAIMPVRKPKPPPKT
jgi:uncharacterized membrane protein